MFPIKRRKLWPFRTQANNMYFTIWLLVAVVIWLSWLLTSKFYLENEASDGTLLYHVSDNVGGAARSVVIRDGTLRSSNLQVNDCLLATVRGKGGLIAIDQRRKISVTNGAYVDDSGVLVCESLVADDVLFEGSYRPLTTMAQECTITSPKEAADGVGDYLVRNAVDDNYIHLLSAKFTGRSLALIETNQSSINGYSLPHFSPGVLRPLPLRISPEIVTDKLPRPSPSLLFVTGSGEVKYLPLPTSVKLRALICAGRDALEWHDLPAGAWFHVDDTVGRYEPGNVLHFDGGGRVSFRAFRKPVNSGNVSVQDPDAPLDVTGTVPPFVQFDGVYGRLRRTAAIDNVTDAQQSIAFLFSCVRRSSKLDSLVQIPWKNEQDLFDQVSVPPPDSKHCHWIVYDEREARLRSDLLTSPSTPSSGRLVLGCKDGTFFWSPIDRYVVLSPSDTYDAANKRISNVGAPRGAHDASRVIDTQNCLGAPRSGGWNAKTKEVIEVDDGIADADAVNLGQCKKFFGVCKNKDGLYDAKDRTIKNLGNAIEQHDAVSKEIVDTLRMQYRSWFKVDYGYKTAVEKLHTIPAMQLMSHEAVNGGFLVPFSDMILERAYLYTTDGPVKVLISNDGYSTVLEKRNEEQFKMFRLDIAVAAETLVKAHIQSEEGGIEGFERKYLLTLFFRNPKEFFMP